MNRGMSGPLARYDAIVAELDARALNAAARNKVTMWAYLTDASRGLREWFSDVDRTDGAYAEAAIRLVDYADGTCPNLPSIEAARLWAQAVYARRILRAWGTGCPRATLDWLRERTGAARPALA